MHEMSDSELAALKTSVDKIGDEVKNLKDQFNDAKLDAQATRINQKHQGEQLDGIRSLLRWILFAFLGTMISAVGLWVIDGGLSYRPPSQGTSQNAQP